MANLSSRKISGSSIGLASFIFRGNFFGGYAFNSSDYCAFWARSSSIRSRFRWLIARGCSSDQLKVFGIRPLQKKKIAAFGTRLPSTLVTFIIMKVAYAVMESSAYPRIYYCWIGSGQSSLLNSTLRLIARF